MEIGNFILSHNIKNKFSDFKRDCVDGSDEAPNYCNTNCNAGEIRCLNPAGGLSCVSKSSMCNGVR
ncbi:unnamed protein product, partial [Rotaria sp. Silwood2]